MNNVQTQLVVVLGAVRDNSGRLLLAKRIDKSIPEAYGKWEFPGGKVDFGEQPEEALLREVYEECGLAIEIKRLLPKVFTHVWETTDGQSVQVFLLTYECVVVDGDLNNLRVADEIGELRFMTVADIDKEALLPNVVEAITYLS